MNTEHTIEKNCRNCMVYRRGECLGRELCDFYKEAPVLTDKTKYWPTEMRHRNSYAGSNSKEYKYDNNHLRDKKKSPKKRPVALGERIGYKRKTIHSASTSNAIVHKFVDEFIIWVSASERDGKYYPNCLLQYNEHTLAITGNHPEKARKRSMLEGLYLSSQRVTKPSTIFVITDTELFINIGTNISGKDDDWLAKVVYAFEKQNCRITEVLFVEGHELIDNHIKNH